MSEYLQEYKKIPKLSRKAKRFVDSATGGEVPEDIRIELERYLKEIEPIVVSSREELISQFERVFGK